jgi:hypothetical protein
MIFRKNELKQELAYRLITFQFMNIQYSMWLKFPKSFLKIAYFEIFICV